MKIALFSDIHANLPAFEAFLADLDIKKPDAIYCLGDLVGYNVWPNEIINEIRRRGIVALAGNHDLKVKGLHPVNNEQLHASGKTYAYHLVEPAGREYLTSLPSHIALEYRLSGETITIFLAHGSPRSIDEYVLRETDESYVLELMDEVNADILCVGHSHKPYHRIIEAKDKIKQVINIGSVGKPKDGNPMGCYVLITLNERISGKLDTQVEFVRFKYNVERAAEAIETSPLPNEFAEKLRKAY